jgi:alpha-beta hydrolase superfamily lysophospholipase
MSAPLPFPTRSPDGRQTLITPDGIRLSMLDWQPPDAPRGVVVLVHGYGEHSGRYGHVADALTDCGVAVYAYDQRGYGRSEGRRAYVDDFDTYLDDLEYVLQAPGVPSDVPRILMGHSMGGLVVLRHALRRAPSVRGLILSAPAIEINPDLAPFLRRIAQWVGRVAPRLRTVRSPEGAISRDPEVVEHAKNDPLNYHGAVRARMGAEMLRAGEEAKEELDALEQPFLVLHGTEDRLVDPAWSQALYDRAASADKTIRLYDGLYHETMNEPERETVLADLTDWLRDHMD